MRRVALTMMLLGCLALLVGCVVRHRRHRHTPHATKVEVSHTPPPDPGQQPPPTDRTPPPPDRTSPPPPPPPPPLQITVPNPSCRRGNNLEITIVPWHPGALVWINGKPVPRRVANRTMVVTVPGDAPTGRGVVEVVWQGKNHAVPVEILP